METPPAHPTLAQPIVSACHRGMVSTALVTRVGRATNAIFAFQTAR